jgi:hypothetical protein
LEPFCFGSVGMKNDGKCWVALVYDWGDNGLQIARTKDASTMRLVKRTLLSEAQNRLSISRDIDEVVASLDEAELKRLQAVLDILVPPEADIGSEAESA